jgi:glycosyltransferase involved in cell wall biosynthesis
MKNGIQLDFVSPYPALALQDQFLENGSRVFRVPNFKKNPLGYCKAIYKVLKDGQYDVAYINMLSAANVLPFVIAQKAHVKRIIAHSHNNDTPKGNTRKVLHFLNYRIVERLATDYWACSREAGLWLFPDIDSKKVIIIPNAIPMASFAFSTTDRNLVRKQLNIQPYTFIFGHVGRFEDQKNHLFLVSLFERLCSVEKDAKLLLVGDGYLRPALESKIKQLGLDERIILVGSTQEVAPYYSAMDAFLFPSKFEGFGMAVLEAQISGLPCVVSDSLPSDVNLTDIQYLSLEQHDWVNTCRQLMNQDAPSYSDRESKYKVCLESKYSIEKAQNKLLTLLIDNA